MIDLSAIPLADAQPEVQDFGGVLTPALGGPVQRIQRIGTRWTFGFETPNLPVEPDLRLWSGRVARAKVEGALCWVPEPDLTYAGKPTAVLTTNLAAGSTLYLGDAGSSVPIPEGKWLSIIHDGRRYLHRVTAEVVTSPDQYATLSIYPMLRTNLTAGDVIELGAPKLQGTLTVGAMPIPLARHAALNFTIAEDE